ncbi:MAG TPA: alpha/beta hydrolase [Acidimicrobiales bacterium]
MTQIATQRLPVNDVELAWWERGAGAPGAPTLVLVHGFSGAALDFALVADELATDRRVVTLDQRGHGHSTKTGRVEGYTLEQLVADLAVVLDTVGDGPVDLLGHSMGGQVVMGLVLSRPDLVGSLVLMDTSARSFTPDDEALAAVVHAWIDAFDPAQGMPESLSIGGPEEALIEATTAPEWQEEKAASFAGMDPYAIKALGLSLLADASDRDVVLEPRLSSITCPTTVIAGQHDLPLADQAPGLAASVADGRLTLIEGAYHSPQLTHPEQWTDAVRAHLAWAQAERDGR